MRIEIWSDIACPWCYIGKVRFQEALERYEHAASVKVEWRSFELQPEAPKKTGRTTIEHLMEKYQLTHEKALEMMGRVTDVAAASGLEFHLDRALNANTFDAHRLVHKGTSVGLGQQVMERFMQAYQSEGEDLADHATLERLAVEAGLEPDATRAVLAGDEFAADVRADQARGRTFGVSGVPFFIIDEAHGISGAQPVEFFLQALQQLGPQQAPVTMLSADATDAGSCDDEGCELPSEAVSADD